jgi:uncharacterized protein
MMHILTPYRVDGTGRTASTENLQAYARSLIEAVLFTAQGERVMRPDFGAGVLDLVFDTNSQALETAAEFLIRSGLQRHLSDVLSVADLALRREEGTLEITLSYVLRETGETLTDTFRQEA